MRRKEKSRLHVSTFEFFARERARQQRTKNVQAAYVDCRISQLPYLPAEQRMSQT